jgi:phage terminase large subunit
LPTQVTNQQKIEEAQEIQRLFEPYPAEFIKKAFESDIWSMQEEITKAVFKYPTTAVKTCNAAGKSYIAARIALAFLILKPGSIVITTAPTWRQVKDVLWREIRTAMASSPYKITDAKANQVGIELGPDWFAVGLSTNGAEKFFGYHADDILVIVDEASGVEDEIFTGVDAVTPNLNAHVLMIGNPTNPEGRFYKAFTSDFVKTFTVTAFDTPNFTANGITNVNDLIKTFESPNGADPLEHMTNVQKNLKVPYPVLQTPSTVYRRYFEWGMEHPNWEALIMAQFPSQSEFSLIPLNLVEKSQQVWKQIQIMDKLAESNVKEDQELLNEYLKHQEWKIEREGTLNYGLDVARFGSDRTVLTARRGGYVEMQKAWAKLDTKITTDMVIDEMNLADWRAVVTVDDTGVGGGVTDQLSHRKIDNPNYHYRTIPINFSEGTNFPDKFFNLRSEMWWYLREKFTTHKIAIPDDEDLRDELVAIRFKYVGKENNIIRVESKDDMKKRTPNHNSPDRADSLLLSMFDLPDDRWSIAESNNDLAKAAEAEPIIQDDDDDLEADPTPSGFGYNGAIGESGDGLRFDDRF